jgi:hypothetical protein
MNKNKFSSILRVGTILVALLITSTSLLQSCDDDEPSAPVSFNIEGDPSGLTSGIPGKTQSYVVRATGSWQIVAKEEGNWVKVFPTEGEDDGIFKITVSANEGFDERLMNLAFVVNGEEQPVLFRVEQDANVPYITLPAKVIIPAPGGNFDVAITSNVEWTYTISNDAWLTEVSKTKKNVTLNAAANTAASSRAVAMTVTAIDFPSLSQTVTLEQSPGSIVLEEDFNWLAYGSAVPYTTGGEKKIADWTPEQQAKGWTSSLNPFSIAANPVNDRLCYARQGFVKIGITNYGGDLISPKLSTLSGTKNLKVTFKAAAYVSSGGVFDSRELVIDVLGAGTPSVTMIMVENVPNNSAQDLNGVVNDIWADDRAFTFTVTGATADTQIRFLGKAFDLTAATPNRNRIFLDDIKVEIIQ